MNKNKIKWRTKGYLYLKKAVSKHNRDEFTPKLTKFEILSIVDVKCIYSYNLRTCNSFFGSIFCKLFFSPQFRLFAWGKAYTRCSVDILGLSEKRKANKVIKAVQCHQYIERREALSAISSFLLLLMLLYAFLVLHWKATVRSKINEKESGNHKVKSLPHKKKNILNS